MYSFLPGAAALVVCTLAAGAAVAHVRLLSPEARSRDDGIKVGPCGRYAPGTGPRTELAAGSRVTVRFEETVDHPGYFRIAFAPDGDAGYDEHVLVPEIAVRRDDPRPHQYSVDVQLPDTPCDGCSLQVVQSMLEDPARPRLYFSCADLRLVAAEHDAGPDSAPDAAGLDASTPRVGADGTASATDASPRDASSADAATGQPRADAMPAADEDTTGDEVQQDTGGCAVAVGAPAVEWAHLLMLMGSLALVGGRGRRRA